MVTVFRLSRTKHSILLLSALNVFGTFMHNRSVIYFRPKLSIAWAIIIYYYKWVHVLFKIFH